MFNFDNTKGFSAAQLEAMNKELSWRMNRYGTDVPDWFLAEEWKRVSAQICEEFAPYRGAD
jgi:hypothetical protein